MRVPMIMRWPGEGGVSAGEVYEKMVSSTDVFPTLVEAAGLNMPEGQPTDGVDLLPYLKGENQAKPHEWLCWQNRSWLPRTKGGSVAPTLRRSQQRHSQRRLEAGPASMKVSGQTLKCHRPGNFTILKNDIGERNDVAVQHPEVVGDLGGLFDVWRRAMHPTVE